MAAFFIQKLTPDERLWRVDWFGEFSYPPGQRTNLPSVRVAISPVLCDPEDDSALLSVTATGLNNQRLVWLPVGVLGAIRIGDIWKNGQCVFSPKYQTEKFEKLHIKRDTTDFVKSGMALEGAFLLPLAEHPWHQLQTMSFCVKVKLEDEKQIIIPCVELIRFYFGSSSRLLNLLFTKQISKDDLYKNMQFVEVTGQLHLKLASGLSGMSAADIGRISLDHDAWRAARLIFDTCMAASVQREAIYPYTGFPFVGTTDLIASGKWLSNGDRPNATFVVFNLHSCSHPFPFESLSYESSDDKKVSTQTNDSKNVDGSQAQTFIASGVKPTTQTLSETDSGTAKASKEIWLKGKPRFPDLTGKRIWRERYDTADPPVIYFVEGVSPIERVSVGKGSSRNGSTREVDFGDGHHAVQLQDIDPKKYKFVFDGIKLARIQNESKFEIAETVLITLPGYTHPVISLPHLVDEYGEIHPVSFHVDSRGDTRCRRGCFVEFRGSESDYERIFIVERAGKLDKVRDIHVSELSLTVAMGRLVKECTVHSATWRLRQSEPLTFT
jgi:hypothetical protein